MDVKIVRSQQRVKTVSARAVDGVFVVQAPAHMSDADLQPVIDKLLKRWQGRQARSSLDDAVLERRARELNQQYFGGKLRWQSIRWVSNQNSLHGSCTPSQGTIRISHRLAAMPTFVRDYVLMHELAHLLEANHGPRFWRLVNQFPRTERARGYLMGAGLVATEE
ncbi:MAG TPA: M48 family metallopeptidase [Anaerolineae bacterium]|nr:M48 family metallopeptidase [Anaerolineae bacterium]HNU05778.1 M48 family metallopeptidase [Anaerolineae bacterium]